MTVDRRGEAFRARLAAQADAALAAGPENPLRLLLEAAPGTREEETLGMSWRS